MKKIKVCSVIPGLRSGGIEKFLLDLYSYGDWSNFDISIITHGVAYDEMLNKAKRIGITVYLVPEKKKHFIENVTNIYKIFRKNKFDILHVHMGHLSFLPLFLGLLANIKIRIMHVHENPNATFKFRIQNFLSKKMSKYYISCSRMSAQKFFDKDNVVKLLPNSIKTEKYLFDNNSRKEIRNKYGILDNEICIGHVGRFVVEKNHKFLIDLFETVKDKKTKLLLVGDGQKKEEIKDYIRSKKLDDRVIFVSYNDQVEKFYSAMDVFAMPSLKEGFGLVALEAQLNGLTCLLSDRIPDDAVFSDDAYKLCLDVNVWSSKLVQILKKKEIKHSIPTKEEILNFDISQQSKNLKDYYLEVYHHE